MKNSFRNDPLKIVIVGRPMSGKTTLALLLTKFLMEQGMEVTVIADPYEGEQELLRIRDMLDERVSAMKGKHVYIEMAMVRKNFDLSKPLSSSNILVEHEISLPGDTGERP
jgi:Ni2+-binding GTPase involved in maturation of urease and hydrogenase